MNARFNEALPWHDAVKVVGRGSTVNQAINDANLARFVVREPKPGKRELFSEDRGSSDSPVFLKELGRSIVPLQNSEAFALFQPLIDLGCLAIDSICEWKGGERVWMVFEVLNCGCLDLRDHLRPFLLFGHDPSTNYFRLSYLFVKASTGCVMTEGTFHNPEPKIPHDQIPRKFSAGDEKACEAVRTHLLTVMTAFKQMSETQISSEEADRYLLDVAHYVFNPAAKFGRTLLSDSQISQFFRASKEQLSRQNDCAELETTTVWDAYTTVIEWVDHEASALQGWERLSELWFSNIKDSALYLALKRIDLAGRNSGASEPRTGGTCE